MNGLFGCFRTRQCGTERDCASRRDVKQTKGPLGIRQENGEANVAGDFGALPTGANRCGIMRDRANQPETRWTFLTKGKER